MNEKMVACFLLSRRAADAFISWGVGGSEIE